MRQLRHFLLLAVALLTGSTMQAQYLNFFGWKQGSVPLDKLNKVAFTQNQDNGKFCLNLYTDQDFASVLSATDVDSLTITDEPYFNPLPVSLEQIFLRIEDGMELKTVKMTPLWGNPGLFYTIIYLNVDGHSFAYSADETEWIPLKYASGIPYYVTGEGWNLLVLDLRSENYLGSSNLFSHSDNRSSYARQGFIQLSGDVTGGEQGWWLSMPVNNGGWWASPRFVADDKLHPYFRTGRGNELFTIYDGHVFLQDCDVPASWLEAKGAAYSVQGKAGQKLYVNMNTMEALVSTPDEVPFPLENPVFRTTTTVNTGYNDPSLCRVEGTNGNTAVLYWDAVDGASGYRIKMGLRQQVSAGGSEVWASGAASSASAHDQSTS